MPKSKEQFIEVKTARKNDIIISALKVFCEKGYAGTTINDIVKKARCSHGLFYHYFSNKKEIFEQVLEAKGNGIMSMLDKVLAEETSYVDKLSKMVEYTFNNIKSDEIFAYRYYLFVSTLFGKVEAGELPKKCSKTPPHIRMHTFFENGICKGSFTNKYTAEECAILYNSIIQGTTLSFILYPKEFRSNFKFPSINFIVDIFKKENN